MMASWNPYMNNPYGSMYGAGYGYAPQQAYVPNPNYGAAAPAPNGDIPF